MAISADDAAQIGEIFKGAFKSAMREYQSDIDEAEAKRSAEDKAKQEAENTDKGKEGNGRSGFSALGWLVGE